MGTQTKTRGHSQARAHVGLQREPIAVNVEIGGFMAFPGFLRGEMLMSSSSNRDVREGEKSAIMIYSGSTKSTETRAPSGTVCVIIRRETIFGR
jgi:hypothetical protein